MNSLLKILAVIAGFLERWQRGQEAKKHEAEVKKVEDKPSQFFADHFSGVSNDNAKPADKANPRRDSIE